MYVSFYLATFWIGLWARLPYFQWIAVASACCATAGTIWLWHGGRWDLGLRVPVAVAGRELLEGLAVALLLIGSADAIIVLTTPLRHAAGHGFPIAQMATVFIPAVLHEELVFRGYPYQILRRSRRWIAIVASSLVFAAFHMGNSDVTPLALVNIFIGGVVLALAYERHKRLWMPIGLHFGWNLVSGPILGYEVSGFPSRQSLLVTIVTGRPLLTGGGFGIEGSVIMTVVEAVAAILLWRTRNGERGTVNGE
ncbi:MAG TPA: CPBP family intramembrane glutamic endopeptidase [Thermoanaerobaculia bacterium]|nr:CPBP family intramembrane glutamic endopeptidase [Thermoanaerobaculia bacterium]